MALRFDIAVSIAFAIVASSAPARADHAIALRLSYEAPAACPSADDFLAAVVARTPLARPAHGDEPATTLEVVVTNVPGGNSGTLELIDTDANSSLREVSAADCQQVVAALALMTALAVDPNAAMVPARHAPAPRPPPSVEARPPPPARAPPRLVFEVGAQLEVLGGAAPDPVWLVRPWVQLASESGSRSPWSYALRLSAGRAHAAVVKAEGSGAFTLWVARLELCPVRFSPAQRLALSACAPLDAGRLEASGKDVTPSNSVARPWLSLGGIGRVEWRVFDVLVLEAAAELFFPLVRDRFFVGSNVTLHRTPALAGGATIGVGVRFP